MELTEKQFCEAYTAYYGEKIDDIRQIQINRSTGMEMFEFAQEIVKLFAIPVVSNNEVVVCQHPYNKVEQNDHGQFICRECGDLLAN